MKKLKYNTIKAVEEPRYIGVNIEQQTYETLAAEARNAGDKLSALIRHILEQAVDNIHNKK